MNERMTATPARAIPVSSAIRRRSLGVGAAATTVAAAGVLWAVLKDPTADSSRTTSLPYVVAVAVIAGGLLFAWLVPARIAANGTGLPLAIASVPLLYAVWSGLPFLLAVAAALLATAHRAAGGTKQGRALAAIIISGPVVVLTVMGILLG